MFSHHCFDILLVHANHILHDSTVQSFFAKYFFKVTSYGSTEHSIIFIIETTTQVLRDTARLAEQQRRAGFKKMPNMSLYVTVRRCCDILWSSLFLRLKWVSTLIKIHSIQNILDSSPWNMFIIFLGMRFTYVLIARKEVMLSQEVVFMEYRNDIRFVEKTQTTAFFS